MPATPQSLLDDAQCYTCLGMSLADALKLVLWDRISDDIGGGGGDTFFRISQIGDVRVSDVADERIYQ